MRIDTERLRDILEAIANIEKYAAQGKEAFTEQELIQVWMVHNLQIIGEAARSISEDFIAQCDQAEIKKENGQLVVVRL